MSVEETKSLFFTDGYATINEVFPIPVIDAAYLQAMRNFDEVNQVIDSKNLHFGIGIKNGFTEIVQRHSHRFEMSYHMDGSEFDFVLQNRSIRDAVSNILECENFIIANRSLVVSRPGCTDQAWHSDGPHVSATQYLPCHVLNVFIPLVDVNIDNGPTEFRPGSQFYTRNLAKSMLIAKLKKQLRPVDAPCIKKGSILLFDYRVLHRGLANKSFEMRPILVFTFSKPWYKDMLNFPHRSVFDDPSKEEQELETIQRET